MIRSNPPPLIHMNFLNKKIFTRNELAEELSGNREDLPLNLSCRRSSSFEYNEVERKSEINNTEIQSPHQVENWGFRYNPLLASFREELSGFYQAQKAYRETILNETIHPVTATSHSGCSLSGFWGISYYPCWQFLNGIPQDSLQKYMLSLDEGKSNFSNTNDSTEQNRKKSDISEDSNQTYSGFTLAKSSEFEKRQWESGEKKTESTENMLESKSTVSLSNTHLPYTYRKIGRKQQNGQHNETTPKARLSSTSFICLQCGASYRHRFELNRHVKVSHIRPHRCHHCGKGFGHKNYLRVHIETVHMGRKSHKCEQCGKYLSTGGNLSVHVRTIHMGEKNYTCPICSRTFGQQCNMKTHMRRHYIENNDLIGA